MRNFDRLSDRRATLPQAINATLQKMKLFAIALSFGAALAADAAEKARLQAALPPAEKVAVVAADPAAKAAATAAPMEATMCTNFCVHSRDGDCDDGGPGSEYSLCARGSDCNDCQPKSTPGIEDPDNNIMDMPPGGSPEGIEAIIEMMNNAGGYHAYGDGPCDRNALGNLCDGR